jgi:hypothetical protein
VLQLQCILHHQNHLFCSIFFLSFNNQRHTKGLYKGERHTKGLSKENNRGLQETEFKASLIGFTSSFSFSRTKNLQTLSTQCISSSLFYLFYVSAIEFEAAFLHIMKDRMARTRIKILFKNRLESQFTCGKRNTRLPQSEISTL